MLKHIQGQLKGSTQVFLFLRLVYFRETSIPASCLSITTSCDCDRELSMLVEQLAFTVVLRLAKADLLCWQTKKKKVNLSNIFKSQKCKHYILKTETKQNLPISKISNYSWLFIKTNRFQKHEPMTIMIFIPKFSPWSWSAKHNP